MFRHTASSRGEQLYLQVFAGELLWYDTEFCGLSRLALAGKLQSESDLKQLLPDGQLISFITYLTDEKRR
jgi:hypothetical protein